MRKLTMKDKKAYDTIVEHASPFITLSYVLDEKGHLLAHFNMHPQLDDEIFITLDEITRFGSEEVMLTPQDVKDFADKLYQFADTAQAIVDRYHKDNANT